MNPVMPMTSLSAAPAMRNVGIPPSTPNPLSCKYKREGTTTAGDTAHNANLKKNVIDEETISYATFIDKILRFQVLFKNVSRKL